MRSIPLAVGLGLGLALLASPATAAFHTQADTTGDVWLQDGPDSYSEHGARDNVDLTATRVRHTKNTVVTTAWFADLARTTDSTTTVFWLRTDAGRTFRVQHTTGAGNRAGRAMLSRYVDGKLVDRRCDDLRVQTSYADDLVRVTFPRHCVGRPQWVRYHGSATAIEEGPGATYVDAMMSGDPANDLYSRRIPRG